jgi:hypothetical protein
VKTLHEVARSLPVQGETPPARCALEERREGLIGPGNVDAAQNTIDRLPEICGSKSSSASAPMISPDVVRETPRSSKDTVGLWRTSMDELRAELDRHRHAWLASRQDPPPDSIACFEDEDGAIPPDQFMRRGQSRCATPDHSSVQEAGLIP